MTPYETTTCCRVCGAAVFEILSFGDTPLADRLLPAGADPDAAPLTPLTLLGCAGCSLVQIRETVPPSILFEHDYPYFSSVSPALRRHFAEAAASLLSQGRGGRGAFVVEAASNDGCLLRHFAHAGARVLGVDPAAAPVSSARTLGIETRETYFGLSTAQEIVETHGPADLFLANNVLAHTPDVLDFVKGVAALLKDDGLAVFETPYLLDLLEKCEYDTIYHQHVFHYSVQSVEFLLARAGLHLNRVERLAIHGGSLRLFVSRSASPRPTVEHLLVLERELHLHTADAYAAFVAQALQNRTELAALVRVLKGRGRKIAAYGAAAKGTMRLSFCSLGRAELDYVVDLNVFKHGKVMPGSGLPIVTPDALLDDPPDDLLILAWNFADEIMAQQAAYAAKGGRFIVPAPQLRVIG